MDQDSIMTKVFGGALTLLIAGIMWLVRTVFTNNKKIILLEQRLEYNAKQHTQMLDEIKTMWREFHDFISHQK